MVNCLIIITFIVVAEITGNSAHYPIHEKPESTLEFYSLAGAPYIHVRSGKLKLQNSKHCAGHTEAQDDAQEQNKQALNKISAYFKDFAKVYADLHQLDNEEQSKLQTISQINQAIADQKKVIEQLKNDKAAQDLQNAELNQNIDDRVNKIAELIKNKAGVQKNLNNLENVLVQDLQAAKKIEEKSAVAAPQPVAKNEQLKDVLKNVINNEIKKGIANPVVQGAVKKVEAVGQLTQQFVGLQGRIHKVEKAIQVLLNKN